MDTKNQPNHFNNPVVTILFLVLVGIGGYFVLTKNSSNTAITQPSQISNSTSSPQQVQINALQKEVDVLKNQKSQTQKAVVPQKNIPSSITSDQIAPFLDGVVEIECAKVSGSGSLWKFDNGYFVVTNNHVINQGTPSDGSCGVIDAMENGFGMYSVYPSESTTWNSFSDVAVLKLHEYKDPSIRSKFPSISSLDYKISALPKCANYVSQGSPVITLGYPAYGGGLALITSNGVIGGYGGVQSLSAPYSNYIISAKIDSGNSGGIALSLDAQGQICLLGIPTWISTGNYENGGVVQNINNITYTK